MRVIDLRSDTITRPTAAMRRAMADAEVGDDVFGEDPTVNRLEEMAAERLGKEAALFVASGTMANLVSLLVHCGRGDEVILGDRSHTFLYEQGGCAALGGIHPRTLVNQPDGTLDLRDVEEAVRPDNVHFPRTRLIVLENTHNRCSGAPLTPEYMKGVGEMACRHNLKVHVDGARIFNAAVALGVDASDLVSVADSATFCLSKGLAAPVGSLVCGSRDFIAEARRARKVLGGGMRQAGVIAAAGIVALTEMIDRLAEDHDNARRLAKGLADINSLSVDPASVKTNIVYINIPRKGMTSKDLADRLRRDGVMLLPTGPRQMRAVTNYHITSDDVDDAVGLIHKAMTE
ncbi:MAG: low-specificity L-threonine aldolase [Desulfobacterales bacterium]|nr:low-specificity L-threonine aldolase [Desulfobacterales bacterium]MBL7101894.1 low-specificity L-threonine aldolase [Desulfobacteraceae bacterium]MBL7172913.1 low-specificity L-threonine aldolase [Desulfobacteraceae bacterium]